jgi:hypothetical protein
VPFPRPPRPHRTRAAAKTTTRQPRKKVTINEQANVTHIFSIHSTNKVSSTFLILESESERTETHFKNKCEAAVSFLFDDIEEDETEATKAKPSDDQEETATAF